MNFHFIYVFTMRLRHILVPGLLMAGSTLSHAQTVAPAPTASIPVVVPASETPRRVLIKVGLNAARAFRNGGYYGVLSRLPLSAGAEYSLNSKFTVYGQLDAEIGLARRTYPDFRYPLVPTGALSLGARYYYNQEGRAQHNRPHGAFVGNYLALEAHTEMTSSIRYVPNNSSPNPSGYFTQGTDYAPSLNLLWGAQRRLGRSFLFDFNAGIGIGPNRSDAQFGGYSSSRVNLSTQVNLGVYFGR